MPTKEVLQSLPKKSSLIRGGDGFSLNLSSLNTAPRIDNEGARPSQTCKPCTPETIRCSNKCTSPCVSVRNCVRPK